MARTKLKTPNFNLNKRADGYYDIRYTENGKVKAKSTGTKDPKAAEDVRARFAAAYRAPSVSLRPTVEEICEAYLQQRSNSVASPKHLGYSLAPVRSRLGPLHADALTQAQINTYIHARKTEKVVRKGGRWGDKPVGDSTINKELRILRAALNWAAAERLIARGPTYKIELTIGRVRDRWITQDEARRIEMQSPPHLALFICLALTTAKRREAILTLTWDRVNLERPGHEFLDFGEDVGNKRRGTTPIAGAVKLIRMLKAAKERSTTDYVIEHRGNKVLDVKTALTNACKRAGVDPISAHVLKHSSITWMVQSGMSYERISKFASTSKEVIERVYGHHSAEFVQEALSAVAY